MNNFIRTFTLTMLLGLCASIGRGRADTFGNGSNSFSLEFLKIGNPGNTNDSTGFGGVQYNYQIAKYDVSVAQLQKAITGGLTHMVAGAWTGDQPANLSWYQAAAFVNWLNTNKGYAPAYNLTWKSNNWSMALWPTNQAWKLGGYNPFRNKDSHYFLTSENEYYKAAYYDPAKYSNSGGYWVYPTGSDSAPTPVASGTNARTAVYNNQTAPASVYLAGGLSPYGTMGQGGQVGHLAEGNLDTNSWDPAGIRVGRGGDYGPDTQLDTSFRGSLYPNIQFYRFGGVRVASVADSPLVYSFTATGLNASSATNQSFTDSGYAVYDDISNQSAIITKWVGLPYAPTPSAKVFWIENNNAIDVQITKPDVGGYKLYSQALTQGNFPNVEKYVIWFSGTNSKVALTTTKSIVVPNKLTGIDNTVGIQGGVWIQNQNATLTIDTTNTLTAITNNESVSTTVTRLSNSLVNQGFSWIPQP